MSSEQNEIQTSQPENGMYFTPLEEVTISGLPQDAVLRVLDGTGDVYVEKDVKGDAVFKVGGALGRHTVIVESAEDIMILDGFKVNCETRFDDGDDWFSHLLNILFYTVSSTNYRRGTVVRLNGKNYTYMSSWIYDHMHGMLGLQYYQDGIKDMVDLFAEGQREDGMIHDNFKHEYSHNSNWSLRFDYGNFVKVPENPDSSQIFVRIPLENSCEYYFIEMLYRAWKATGDTKWMQDKLDKCLKAVEYATSNPYRWSEELQLMKKGYSIDMWDFQSDYDKALVGGDSMKVTLEDTHFNIFYGDSARMAFSCRCLAEMLDHVGRSDESAKMRELADGLKERVDKVSWRGTHYQHMVPLEPDALERDFGDVDTTKQVTLHNAYLLNRGVTHQQAVAIIKTYQRIHQEMPESSPGEFYTCYPPFEKGFSAPKWNYMNGGVTTIAAGALAHGAFEHGFEDYGVDILKRMRDFAAERGNQFPGCYKGAIEPAPERSFTTLDMRGIVNADFHGDRGKTALGWTDEGDNDLRNMPVGKQVFEEIPFDVINPEENDWKACLGISRLDKFAQKAELPVGQKAQSIYLLHTKGGGNYVGMMRVVFADGTEELHHIADHALNGDGPAIGNWWGPSVNEPRVGIPHLKVAWRGENPVCNNVGVYAYGYNNPHPDKEIEKICFDLPNDNSVSRWMILGVTLSDAEVYFEPTIESTIPAQWGAGDMYHAFVEGLAGIQDHGVAFSKARIVPRWEAAGKDEVHATFRYASSEGYVSYHYKKDEVNGKKEYMLEFTGAAKDTLVEMLLPSGVDTCNVTLDGQNVNAEIRKVEASRYAMIPVEGSGVHKVVMTV